MTDVEFGRLCNTYGFAPSRALRELIDCVRNQEISTCCTLLEGMHETQMGNHNKHTPGPWLFYDDSNDGKTNRIEIVGWGKTVARIYHSVPEEDLPNARLIAAAPDLLEALKMLVLATKDFSIGHYNEEVHDIALSKARAAIAKVEEKQ